MIKIKKLTKKFDGIVALDTIDLELAAGKIIGLVGPDGTGKTTLLRLIAGLLKPTTGSIAVNGLDTITEANGVHEIISYMPQKFGLYEDLTVMQNLTLYADLQGLSREERERQFKRLLDFTALAPFTKRYAQNLSGGMKQKLGLACTLLRKQIKRGPGILPGPHDSERHATPARPEYFFSSRVWKPCPWHFWATPEPR